MKATAKQTEPVTFSPDLRADDALANYWMRQVTLRLRREISWCWHERGMQAPPDSGALPPFVDRVSNTLDLSRFWAEKQDFFLTDPAARYLTEQLSVPPPGKRTLRSAAALRDGAARGSFSWVVDQCALDDVAAFTLALSLSVAFDGSMGSVIAACLNDQTRTQSSLALAQRLWDQPEEVLRIADPFHPLFRQGLLNYAGQSRQYFSEARWDAPITVPSLVAAQLLFPGSPFPHGLALLDPKADDANVELTETARVVSLRLRTESPNQLHIVPVIGAKGSARRETVLAIANANGKAVVEFDQDTTAFQDTAYLDSIATVAWLRDSYLFFSREPLPIAGDKHRSDRIPLPAATIAATAFVALSERGQLAQLPSAQLLPPVYVPASSYAERRQLWKDGLGEKAAGLEAEISECARRFRFERAAIRAVCAELKELPGQITAANLIAACRAELDSDIGELASRVEPRFDNESLVLPHRQDQLFAEILKAMKSLTEVHYGWGTAKVWNEGGISVLFAGPPGTGKTMAAEILSIKLDLPMYRIDLSQVVNKYIGETEKNLKRVFDTADVSDMILFFDEADSLFGRRTEVSDAHDRYANLEISYLLERMERFKGLAILATNRKKDLDDAFLRRLRYIVDFPLPEAPERKRIWQQVIPANADSSELDFDFLAEQFPFSGGNIRSIVFNACLQCADGSLGENRGPARLRMKEVIVAAKREYDKINRKMGLEQFGSYAAVVAGLER